MKAIRKFNRFTSLPVLLDFLQRKKLVLLNPRTWDDANDKKVILEYKRRRKIKKLFALCFSHGDETVHHWKAFSDGSSGCCIEFYAKVLRKVFSTTKNARHGRVLYKRLNEIKTNPPALSHMPFIKRWPYRCEEEYRVIWEGDTTENYLEIDVPLSAINKITISQRMPKQVFETIKSSLRKTFRHPKKKINLSTLYENKKWISYFKKTP